MFWVYVYIISLMLQQKLYTRVEKKRRQSIVDEIEGLRHWIQRLLKSGRIWHGYIDSPVLDNFLYILFSLSKDLFQTCKPSFNVLILLEFGIMNIVMGLMIMFGEMERIKFNYYVAFLMVENEYINTHKCI